MTGTFTVTPNDLASTISPCPTDVYAKVFATPRLVAFMEIVCSRMLVPYMSKGQQSVGVRVDVTHSAATAEGEEVTVKATFIKKDGKSFVFEVVAHDAAGEIGKATHVRAFVQEERLYAGAKRRKAGASKI